MIYELVLFITMNYCIEVTEELMKTPTPCLLKLFLDQNIRLPSWNLRRRLGAKIHMLKFHDACRNIF